MWERGLGAVPAVRWVLLVIAGRGGGHGGRWRPLDSALRARSALAGMPPPPPSMRCQFCCLPAAGFDPYADVAAAANNALRDTFPNGKLAAALAHTR
jgi:hypothetical protein